MRRTRKFAGGECAATGAGSRAARPSRSARTFASHLFGLTALSSGVVLLANIPASANPKGGQVSAGSAVINQASPTQLDIVQSTDRAAINWQSFSIAPNEQTNFQQPAASSVTLNRVAPGDPSVIAGRLTANGQIVLINPSGITFSKGSQVDVNTLIATPTDISNANFMAGQMKFDKPSTDPRATVVNQGTITVAQKGLAALVAPGVTNSGTIQAKLGKVVLAGAQTYTVDFYGDGLISFDVGSQVTTVPIGPDGKPMTNLVSNTGRISAPGGTVLLTADAAAGIVENVVNVPGQIIARTRGQTPGSVTIDAGPSGGVNLSGKIDVSGLKPGQSGGSATVTGGSVNLASTARIAARGNAGGGTVRIGGGPHGQNPTVRNAQTTNVAAGAVIDASATANGSGGQVAVWSGQATQFAGSVSATGGNGGGNGGFVEVSSSNALGFTGTVNVGAPHGTPGTILLDPRDLTITVNGQNDNDVGPGGVAVGSPDQNTDISVSASALTALTGNLLIEASRDLTVAATLNFTNQISGNEVRFLAGRNLTVNSGVQITTAGADLLLAAAVPNDGPPYIPGNTEPITFANFSSAGTLTINGSLNSGTGVISLVAGTVGDLPTGGISINGSIMSTHSIDLPLNIGVVLSSTGPITEVPTASISVPYLRALTLNDSGAQINLEGAGNQIDAITLSALNRQGTAAAAGPISFVNGQGFQIFQVNTEGDFDPGLKNQEFGINTSSDVDLLAASASGPASITSNEKISATNLSVRTQSGISGDIILTNFQNAVSGNVTLSALNTAGTAAAAGTINFVDSTGFTVGGVNTNASITLEGGGTISINGVVGNSATGPVSVTADSNDILVNAPITSGSSISLFADSNIGLAANLSAPAMFLDAFGAINQSAGAIAANTLDVSDPGGSVSLPGANAVGTLTGFASGTFLFRDDSHTLTVGCVANGDSTDCGVSTNGSNIILETTTSGNLVLNQTVNANNNPPIDPSTILGSTPGLIGLSSAGTITQDPTNGLIVAAGLEIQSGGAVSLGAANRLGANDVPQSATGVAATPGTLSGNVITAGQSFLFRDDRAGLTISTVDVVDSFGARQLKPQTLAALPSGGISGVTANGGNIILETTTAGNLLLSQAVNAGAGLVGLASAGTTTQDPAPIVASSLEILSADRVSLGAFGGTSNPNQVGTLAGQVLNAGESFVFRNDAANLTIGTVDVVDSFGARLLNPVSSTSLTGALSGVVTNNANVGLRVTTSGNLLLTTNINAGSAGVGLESAGQIRQTAGTVTGSSLEVSAVGPVSLPDANVVPVLAGQVTGSQNSFSFRDDGVNLTVSSVGPLLETGTGTPPNNQMLSVAALSGVTSNAGNILLETTTSGNLALNQSINAGTGQVGLSSAGTVAQDPAPIVASSLAILSADRVSLGAFGGTSDLNQVGTLAGQVLNAGESFVFRNDAAHLTIGTVDVVDSYGARLLNPVSLAPLTAALSGVVTNNANIGLRVTTSGNLLLKANINAGSAGIGLESAGQIQQTAGTVTGSSLEISAAGPVSLPDTNAVQILAGQVTGSQNSFSFRDDGVILTVGSAGPLLETGTGTPPNNRMLSVAALSGVTTNNGNIALTTTTSGDLELNRAVNAGTGSVGLTSAGRITQLADPVAAITAQNLVARTQDDAGADLTLTSPDNTVPGNVTLSALNTAGTAPAAGNIAFVDSTGFTVAAQPANGVGDQEIGLDTAATAVLRAGGALQETGSIAALNLDVFDTGGSVSLPGANAVGTLTSSATGNFSFRNDAHTLTVGCVANGGSADCGVSTNGGKIALQTTTAGDLIIAQNVNANGGPVALVSAGNASETGGAVMASGLIVDAAGNVAFGTQETGNAVVLGNPNAVGTVAGSAGGAFGFLNAAALTIGTVPSVLDVATQSGISASAGDVLIQTNGAGQQLTLAGNISAGGRAILDSAGAFSQIGSVNVSAPVLAIDTTGSGVGSLLSFIPPTNVSAGVIGNLPPAGRTSNAMGFAGLQAPNSTVLLFADRGVVDGVMNVGQLGLSGTGASADLNGSIGGVTGPTAALSGFRSPGPDPVYLFNDCIIAATNCGLPPVPVEFLVVDPQAASELAVLAVVPNLTATVTLVTPQPVTAGEQQDPDTPVINIFDEERLCTETAGPAQTARERCEQSR
jgi:filamentous hemagglutinin family protein